MEYYSEENTVTSSESTTSLELEILKSFQRQAQLRNETEAVIKKEIREIREKLEEMKAIIRELTGEEEHGRSSTSGT